MSVVWLLLVLLAVPCVSIGQSVSGGATTSVQLPEFEVATIKPTTPGGGYLAGVNVASAGRVQIRSVPLTGLMCIAFRVGYWQLSGGEAWMEKTLFDVDAEPPEISPGSNRYDTRHTALEIEDGRLRQMLQGLLIERFQLRSTVTPRQARCIC